MYLKAKMTRVKKPSDVPVTKHYAILVYNITSVYREGDERSKTHPGHGYPSGYDTYDSFEHYVTEDKNVWLAAIEEFMNSDKKNDFICFEVQKLVKVNMKMVVEIEN